MAMTIEQAMARVPMWRQASSFRATPLPGGITNVNYRVDVDGEAFVVRLEGQGTARLGIDRRRERQCLIAAGRTGVGPAVVYCPPAGGILVTRFIEGRRLSAEQMRRPETIARVVRSFHLYHGGPAFDGDFSPFRTLEVYLREARTHRAPVPDDIDRLYDRAAEIESALRPGWPAGQPCHNDLWGPNLIDDGALVRIVDWEYAGMGNIYFDLANFAIHHAFSDIEDEALLRAYFGEVSDASVARLNLLKAIAELREGMWCMVGVGISGADFDFLGYAATHFDRCRQALNDSRVPRWMTHAAAGA